MKPKSQHIIYRQILDISFSTRKEALNGQDEISEIYRKDLLPLINKIFDDVIPDNEYLRIDSLELDLGKISIRNMRQDLIDGIHKQLKDKIVKCVYDSRNKDVVTSDNVDGYQSTKAEGLRSLPVSQIELFVHFIKTGLLPWWARKTKFVSLGNLTKKLIKNQPDAMVGIFEDLFSIENYRKRLIHHLSNHELLKVIELYDKSWTTKISDIHNDFIAIHQHHQIIPLNKQNFYVFLWDATLKYIFSDSIAYTISEQKVEKSQVKNKEIHSRRMRISGYINFLVRMLIVKKRSLSSSETNLEIKKAIHDVIVEMDKKKRALKTPEIKTIFRQNVDYIFRDKDEPYDRENVVINEEENKVSLSANPDDSSIDSFDKENKGEEIEHRIRSVNKPLELEDSIEVNNAGLVLLWPYLPMFFEELGLVENKAFVTKDAAYRSTIILQYLVTGETEFEEYDLALNKILCGLPVDEPMPLSFEITHAEIEESQNLLDAVLKNWTALKSTSREGLRQTFLIKQGILKNEMQGWKLIIERSTVDILIDKLPWGISIIKLPWCEHLLNVEW